MISPQRVRGHPPYTHVSSPRAPFCGLLLRNFNRAAARTSVLAALLFVLLSVPAFGLDTSKLHPEGYVSDFAHALNASRASIESYCGEVERSTVAQIAVVLVASLEDEPTAD